VTGRNEDEGLEELGRGRWVRLVRLGKWEFAERVRGSRAVMIAAITDDDELIVVEQHRPAVGGSTIELPAGLVGDDSPDELAELAAARELEEETGYRPSRLIQVAEGCSTAGLTNERVTAFVAERVQRVGDGGGVEGENITVHLVPLTELDDWIATQTAAGKTLDLKLHTGVYWALRVRAQRNDP